MNHHTHRLPSWLGGDHYHAHRDGSLTHYHPAHEPNGTPYYLIRTKRVLRSLEVTAGTPAGEVIGEIHRVTRSTDTKIPGTRLRRPGKGAIAWRWRLASTFPLWRTDGERDTRREAVEGLIEQHLIRKPEEER